MRKKRPHPPADPPESCLARLIWNTIYTLLIMGIIGFLSILGSYYYFRNQLGHTIANLTTYRTAVGGVPRIYDRYGELLFELEPVEQRRAIPLEDIPDTLKQATVTVEDDTFWENWGVDPAAIGAAALYNTQNQGARPVGASTITQQLVRHVAFSYEERVTASYQRKLKEIFLAFILTQERPKEEILELYLNEIYYGNLAYGAEAAAQTYFGHSAADLNLAQSAFLAGLPQAPIQWDPYTNFSGAKERQELILDLMVADGVITADDAAAAKLETLSIQPRIITENTADTTQIEAAHFVLYIQNLLEQQYGPDAIYRGGWQVTTTLDLNIQKMAEQAARDHIAQWGPNHDAGNASVVVLKPNTNEILGMVGSLDYFDSAIDGRFNMTLVPRQPGSTFKPITFAAAMAKGWNAGDVLWDVPIEVEVGREEKMTPVNYDGRYRGPVLFRDALANSYNIPPLQLARDIGLPHLINTGRRMGLRSLVETPGHYGLSLTLGGGEIPLLEMTNAFSTLANGGKYRGTIGILEIRDGQDNLLYQADPTGLPPLTAVDESIAYIITDILDDDQARRPAMGYSNPLELPFPAAAKTGTTNDTRDALTIGYTPNLVVGVWVGNTDNRPMRNTSGLRAAAPLWNTIMRTIITDGNLGRSLLLADGSVPPQEFSRPDNVITQDVCLPQGTGGTACRATRPDLFIANAPTHGVGRLGYTPNLRTTAGAWEVDVLPLPASAAGELTLTPLENGVLPPTPRYCAVNGNVPNAQSRLFLQIPPFYPDEVRARLWARRYGSYQIAPPTACPLSLIRAQNQPRPTAAPTQPSADGG